MKIITFRVHPAILRVVITSTPEAAKIHTSQQSLSKIGCQSSTGWNPHSSKNKISRLTKVFHWFSKRILTFHPEHEDKKHRIVTMKSLIGRALLAQVLDAAEAQANEKDYNQLKNRMAKAHTNKKIRNKFTIDYIMSKFTTMKLKLVQHRFM